MSLISRICVGMIVFYCSFTAIGENILKKIDFSKDSQAVEDKILGVKVLKDSKEYCFYRFRLNDVNNGLEIKIKASARNGAKLGIIVFREPRPAKLVKVKQYWNIKFPENKLGTKTFKVDYFKDMKMLGGSCQVFIYRSNRKGELLVNNISVRESDSQAHLQKQLDETYLGSNKAPTRKPHPFLFSVFIYDYHWQNYAREDGLDFFKLMDEQFAVLHNHGVNALNMAVSNQENFVKLLKLAEKHKLFLFLQLDFAYFQPAWTVKHMKIRAKRAAKFIDKYKSHPNVIAFTVKEEVALKDVKKLSEYYKLILAQVPDAPLQLLVNYLKPVKKLPEPYPAYIGTDRYGFFFSGCCGGYLASPTFALNWTRAQTHEYYIQAAKRNAEFFLVTTVNAMTAPKMSRRYCVKSDFEKYINGKPEAKKKKLQAQRKKYLELAEGNLLGWKKFTRNNKTGYSYWRYYRPPAICVKAMAWISVLEGAKTFSIWSYQLHSREKLKKTNYEASAFGPPKSELGFCTLAGRPNIPNPQFNAYAEAAKEIMPYSKIIINMDKLKGSPLCTKTKDMFMRAYRYRGIDGYVVVVYNNHVGTCPGNKNIYLNAKTTLKLDDQANIVGFIPEINSREVVMRQTLSLKGYSIFDIAAGKKISPVNGAYKQKILPGSGKLFFVGTIENANKLHAMMGK
jgi:hypothetical protein